MNAGLLDRLDIALAAVANAGTSRPEGWLIDQILEPPAPSASNGSAPKPSKRRMSREQAEKVAKDLEGYDGKVVGGRLT
jgi:hypothetical protein